ncbi:unnamed protein product [Amoebophrya sp. A120]|nr:unnamed protein product [Amoebophrya sp. A120]|eukprot:GSA120T00021432001.1
MSSVSTEAFSGLTRISPVKLGVADVSTTFFANSVKQPGDQFVELNRVQSAVYSEIASSNGAEAAQQDAALLPNLVLEAPPSSGKHLAFEVVMEQPGERRAGTSAAAASALSSTSTNKLRSLLGNKASSSAGGSSSSSSTNQGAPGSSAATSKRTLYVAPSEAHLATYFNSRLKKLRPDAEWVRWHSTVRKYNFGDKIASTLQTTSKAMLQYDPDTQEVYEKATEDKVDGAAEQDLSLTAGLHKNQHGLYPTSDRAKLSAASLLVGLPEDLWYAACSDPTIFTNLDLICLDHSHLWLDAAVSNDNHIDGLLSLLKNLGKNNNNFPPQILLLASPIANVEMLGQWISASSTRKTKILKFDERFAVKPWNPSATGIVIPVADDDRQQLMLKRYLATVTNSNNKNLLVFSGYSRRAVDATAHFLKSEGLVEVMSSRGPLVGAGGDDQWSSFDSQLQDDVFMTDANQHSHSAQRPLTTAQLHENNTWATGGVQNRSTLLKESVKNDTIFIAKVASVQDGNLKALLQSGIGVLHREYAAADREVVWTLFCQGMIRVCVAEPYYASFGAAPEHQRQEGPNPAGSSTSARQLVDDAGDVVMGAPPDHGVDSIPAKHLPNNETYRRLQADTVVIAGICKYGTLDIRDGTALPPNNHFTPIEFLEMQDCAVGRHGPPVLRVLCRPIEQMFVTEVLTGNFSVDSALCRDCTGMAASTGNDQQMSSSFKGIAAKGAGKGGKPQASPRVTNALANGHGTTQPQTLAALIDGGAFDFLWPYVLHQDQLLVRASASHRTKTTNSVLTTTSTQQHLISVLQNSWFGLRLKQDPLRFARLFSKEKTNNPLLNAVPDVDAALSLIVARLLTKWQKDKMIRLQEPDKKGDGDDDEMGILDLAAIQKTITVQHHKPKMGKKNAGDNTNNCTSNLTTTYVVGNYHLKRHSARYPDISPGSVQKCLDMVTKKTANQPELLLRSLCALPELHCCLATRENTERDGATAIKCLEYDANLFFLPAGKLSAALPAAGERKARKVFALWMHHLADFQEERKEGYLTKHDRYKVVRITEFFLQHVLKSLAIEVQDGFALLNLIRLSRSFAQGQLFVGQSHMLKQYLHMPRSLVSSPTTLTETAIGARAKDGTNAGNKAVSNSTAVNNVNRVYISDWETLLRLLDDLHVGTPEELAKCFADIFAYVVSSSGMDENLTSDLASILEGEAIDLVAKMLHAWYPFLGDDLAKNLGFLAHGLLATQFHLEVAVVPLEEITTAAVSGEQALLKQLANKKTTSLVQRRKNAARGGGNKAQQQQTVELRVSRRACSSVPDLRKRGLEVADRTLGEAERSNNGSSSSFSTNNNPSASTSKIKNRNPIFPARNSTSSSNSKSTDSSHEDSGNNINSKNKPRDVNRIFIPSFRDEFPRLGHGVRAGDSKELVTFWQKVFFDSVLKDTLLLAFADTGALLYCSTLDKLLVTAGKDNYPSSLNKFKPVSLSYKKGITAYLVHTKFHGFDSNVRIKKPSATTELQGGGHPATEAPSVELPLEQFVRQVAREEVTDPRMENNASGAAGGFGKLLHGLFLPSRQQEQERGSGEPPTTTRPALSYAERRNQVVANKSSTTAGAPNTASQFGGAVSSSSNTSLNTSGSFPVAQQNQSGQQPFVFGSTSGFGLPQPLSTSANNHELSLHLPDPSPSTARNRSNVPGLFLPEQRNNYKGKGKNSSSGLQQFDRARMLANGTLDGSSFDASFSSGLLFQSKGGSSASGASSSSNSFNAGKGGFATTSKSQQLPANATDGTIFCKCNLPAKECFANKTNRYFWGCARGAKHKGGCGFFQPILSNEEKERCGKKRPPVFVPAEGRAAAAAELHDQARTKNPDVGFLSLPPGEPCSAWNNPTEKAIASADALLKRIRAEENKPLGTQKADTISSFSSNVEVEPVGAEMQLEADDVDMAQPFDHDAGGAEVCDEEEIFVNLQEPPPGGGAQAEHRSENLFLQNPILAPAAPQLVATSAGENENGRSGTALLNAAATGVTDTDAAKNSIQQKKVAPTVGSAAPVAVQPAAPAHVPVVPERKQAVVTKPAPVPAPAVPSVAAVASVQTQQSSSAAFAAPPAATATSFGFGGFGTTTSGALQTTNAFGSTFGNATTNFGVFGAANTTASQHQQQAPFQSQFGGFGKVNQQAPQPNAGQAATGSFPTLAKLPVVTNQDSAMASTESQPVNTDKSSSSNSCSSRAGGGGSSVIGDRTKNQRLPDSLQNRNGKNFNAGQDEDHQPSSEEVKPNDSPATKALKRKRNDFFATLAQQTSADRDHLQIEQEDEGGLADRDQSATSKAEDDGGAPSVIAVSSVVDLTKDDDGPPQQVGEKRPVVQQEVAIAPNDDDFAELQGVPIRQRNANRGSKNKRQRIALLSNDNNSGGGNVGITAGDDQENPKSDSPTKSNKPKPFTFPEPDLNPDERLDTGARTSALNIMALIEQAEEKGAKNRAARQAAAKNSLDAFVLPKNGSAASTGAASVLGATATTTTAPPIATLRIQKKYLDAIKSGKKTVEGRVKTGNLVTVRPGNTLRLESGPMNKCEVVVKSVREFGKFSDMLASMGVENCLPGCKSVAEGVEIYHAFPDYEDKARRYGVVAFVISLPDGGGATGPPNAKATAGTSTGFGFGGASNNFEVAGSSTCFPSATSSTSFNNNTNASSNVNLPASSLKVTKKKLGYPHCFCDRPCGFPFPIKKEGPNSGKLLYKCAAAGQGSAAAAGKNYNNSRRGNFYGNNRPDFESEGFVKGKVCHYLVITGEDEDIPKKYKPEGLMCAEIPLCSCDRPAVWYETKAVPPKLFWKCANKQCQFFEWYNGQVAVHDDKMQVVVEKANQNNNHVAGVGNDFDTKNQFFVGKNLKKENGVRIPMPKDSVPSGDAAGNPTDKLRQLLGKKPAKMTETNQNATRHPQQQMRHDSMQKMPTAATARNNQKDTRFPAPAAFGNVEGTTNGDEYKQRNSSSFAAGGTTTAGSVTATTTGNGVPSVSVSEVPPGGAATNSSFGNFTSGTDFGQQQQHRNPGFGFTNSNHNNDDGARHKPHKKHASFTARNKEEKSLFFGPDEDKNPFKQPFRPPARPSTQQDGNMSVFGAPSQPQVNQNKQSNFGFGTAAVSNINGEARNFGTAAFNTNGNRGFGFGTAAVSNNNVNRAPFGSAAVNQNLRQSCFGNFGTAAPPAAPVKQAQNVFLQQQSAFHGTAVSQAFGGTSLRASASYEELQLLKAGKQSSSVAPFGNHGNGNKSVAHDQNLQTHHRQSVPLQQAMQPPARPPSRKTSFLDKHRNWQYHEPVKGTEVNASQNAKNQSESQMQPTNQDFAGNVAKQVGQSQFLVPPSNAASSQFGGGFGRQNLQPQHFEASAFGGLNLNLNNDKPRGLQGHETASAVPGGQNSKIFNAANHQKNPNQPTASAILFPLNSINLRTHDAIAHREKEAKKKALQNELAKQEKIHGPPSWIQPRHNENLGQHAKNQHEQKNQNGNNNKPSSKPKQYYVGAFGTKYPYRETLNFQHLYEFDKDALRVQRQDKNWCATDPLPNGDKAVYYDQFKCNLNEVMSLSEDPDNFSDVFFGSSICGSIARRPMTARNNKPVVHQRVMSSKAVGGSGTANAGQQQAQASGKMTRSPLMQGKKVARTTGTTRPETVFTPSPVSKAKEKGEIDRELLGLGNGRPSEVVDLTAEDDDEPSAEKRVFPPPSKRLFERIPGASPPLKKFCPDENETVGHKIHQHHQRNTVAHIDPEEIKSALHWLKAQIKTQLWIIAKAKIDKILAAIGEVLVRGEKMPVAMLTFEIQKVISSCAHDGNEAGPAHGRSSALQMKHQELISGIVERRAHLALALQEYNMVQQNNCRKQEGAAQGAEIFKAAPDHVVPRSGNRHGNGSLHRAAVDQHEVEENSGYNGVGCKITNVMFQPLTVINPKNIQQNKERQFENKRPPQMPDVMPYQQSTALQLQQTCSSHMVKNNSGAPQPLPDEAPHQIDSIKMNYFAAKKKYSQYKKQLREQILQQNLPRPTCKCGVTTLKAIRMGYSYMYVCHNYREDQGRGDCDFIQAWKNMEIDVGKIVEEVNKVEQKEIEKQLHEIDNIGNFRNYRDLEPGVEKELRGSLSKVDTFEKLTSGKDKIDDFVPNGFSEKAREKLIQEQPGMFIAGNKKDSARHKNRGAHATSSDLLDVDDELRASMANVNVIGPDDSVSNYVPSPERRMDNRTSRNIHIHEQRHNSNQGLASSKPNLFTLANGNAVPPVVRKNENKSSFADALFGSSRNERQAQSRSNVNYNVDRDSFGYNNSQKQLNARSEFRPPNRTDQKQPFRMNMNPPAINKNRNNRQKTSEQPIIPVQQQQQPQVSNCHCGLKAKFVTTVDATRTQIYGCGIGMAGVPKCGFQWECSAAVGTGLPRKGSSSLAPVQQYVQARPAGLSLNDYEMQRLREQEEEDPELKRRRLYVGMD